MTALVSPASSSPGLPIIVSSPSVSVNCSNDRSCGLTSLYPAPKRLLRRHILSSSQHLFDCMRQSSHVSDISPSVLSVSVIMMSMTSCNFLLASFGASSSTVKLNPLGVLSNGMTLPISILYANARSCPTQTHCPCCAMGLTAIRGLRTSACRDSMSSPSVSLDTSKRRPSSHRTVERCTAASASQ